jgi:hypothetical protein
MCNCLKLNLGSFCHFDDERLAAASGSRGTHQGRAGGGGPAGDAHFKRHLVIGAKIDRLDIAPRPQIPKMNPMAILVGEQIFRDNSILELRWQPPLTCHHVVARQVPPEIIARFDCAIKAYKLVSASGTGQIYRDETKIQKAHAKHRKTEVGPAWLSV